MARNSVPGPEKAIMSLARACCWRPGPSLTKPGSMVPAARSCSSWRTGLNAAAAPSSTLTKSALELECHDAAISRLRDPRESAVPERSRRRDPAIPVHAEQACRRRSVPGRCDPARLLGPRPAVERHGVALVQRADPARLCDHLARQLHAARSSEGGVRRGLSAQGYL